MENKLSIVQEKLLRISPSIQYPLIFDKSHKGYRAKDVEENAWQEIASAIDFLSTGKSC